jgi:hypothetical protein
VTGPDSRVPAPPGGDLDEIVARIRRIPDRYRVYAVPTSRVVRIFRTPEPVLRELTGLGFPHATVDGDTHYDRRDLENLVLFRAQPSPQWTALGMLPDALAAGARGPVVRRTVDVTARCPQPGHTGACDFAVAGWPADSAPVRSVRRLAPHHLRLELELPGGPSRQVMLEPAGRALFDEVAALQFHHIPEELAGDLDFLDGAGLADCRLANAYLVSRAEGAGLRARTAAGLFVAPPFSNDHCWTELLVNGEWVPVDPFFLAALARWGLTDPDVWPVIRSPRGTYWRRPDDGAALLTHRGEAVPVSLLTR